MTTVIEGTLDEVLEHLHGLSLPPDMRISVTVNEESEAKRRERQLRAELEQKYANWPRRYGILQIPNPQAVTLEQIKELSEE